jgi:hypothetical protein
MLSLTNDQLVVTVLDPVADVGRLGSRYCTGGYVYAVADQRRGVITSGPGYPDEPEPPVFDGQGLPEAFPSPLWAGMPPVATDARPTVGTSMLVIGVGQVAAVAPDQWREMPVQEFCRWQIAESSTAIRMVTSQEHADWALELTREVRLLHRTVVSETRLVNRGRAAIPFRWFPHPFFPHPRGEACRFNLPIRVSDHPGYTLGANGFVYTRMDQPWDRRGHFLALDFTPGDRLVTEQRHPVLGMVVASCSYTPSFLPIWGNRYCFSFEPYLARTVEPGAEDVWSITYDF